MLPEQAMLSEQAIAITILSVKIMMTIMLKYLTYSQMQYDEIEYISCHGDIITSGKQSTEYDQP